MKNLITAIAKALVDDPGQVLVREINTDHTKILELKVANADIGRVIGREGRTARAMRTILSAVSAKEKQHSILEILE